MRAFAGEARQETAITFAAAQAKENNSVIEAVTISKSEKRAC